MKKISEYILALLCWFNIGVCFAVEKFEILPDLPDPLAAYAHSAEAATVSGGADTSSLAGGSIGHEPSLISVVFSLLIVILLIYLTGIIYTKLNKVGFNALKKQQGVLSKSQVAVVSTTALGNNKTLHVVELDGKRMLIGASSGAIQLIKDLGAVEKDGEAEEFSSIEIPKIEIPTVSFSKLATKIHKELKSDVVTEEELKEGYDKNQDANSDGIIDSLFTKPEPPMQEVEQEVNPAAEHMVDPDEYALYKKYL